MEGEERNNACVCEVLSMVTELVIGVIGCVTSCLSEAKVYTGLGRPKGDYGHSFPLIHGFFYWFLGVVTGRAGSRDGTG